MTFHHPFWVGEVLQGKSGTSQGSMKTWVPFPSPPQCDTSHGLWKGQEPPAGHSGFPLARGRWQGDREELGRLGGSAVAVCG